MIMNKVDLNNLTYYGNEKIRVNWKDSIGEKIPFQYDDIKGELEIVVYDSINKRVIISYNNKISKITPKDLKECHLGSFLNKRTREFKYNINDTISNKLILKRFYQGSYKKYQILCLLCNKESVVDESTMKKSYYCKYCRHSKEARKTNIEKSVYSTNPELIKYFYNIEDAKTHSVGFPFSARMVCPICGNNEQFKQIHKLSKTGFRCKKCSDGVSMGEKYVKSLLEQLQLEFECQYSFEDSTKKNGKRYNPIYDFIIFKNNIILEIDGGQHDLEEQKEIDDIKNDFAILHNYNIIRIKYNTYDYSSLSKELITKLPYDTTKVNWNKCVYDSLNTDVLKAVELWNNGLLISNIAQICDHNKDTISNYLKIGNDLSLCEYNHQLAINRRTQYNKKHSSHKRKIICNETKDVFDSIVQCSEKSLDTFGVHIGKSSISEYLRGKNKTAKGYTFSYIN